MRSGARMRLELEATGVGPGTLAICGGARGADIIFGELARRAGGGPAHAAGAARRPRCWRSPSGSPATRVGGRSGSTDWSSAPRWRSSPSGSAIRRPEWTSSRVRTCGSSTRHGWRRPVGGFSAILVWDEQPTGDGPGGTSDFAERAERMSSRFAIVNPTKLEDAQNDGGRQAREARARASCSPSTAAASAG